MACSNKIDVLSKLETHGQYLHGIEMQGYSGIVPFTTNIS